MEGSNPGKAKPLEYRGKIKAYHTYNTEVVIGSLIFRLPPSMQTAAHRKAYPPGTRVLIEYNPAYEIKSMIDAEVEQPLVTIPFSWGMQEEREQGGIE